MATTDPTPCTGRLSGASFAGEVGPGAIVVIGVGPKNLA